MKASEVLDALKVAAIVAGGVLLFLGYRKASAALEGMGVAEAVATVAQSAVEVADDAAAGVVVGIGQAVGIPATDESECDRARREGRTWDASFACPAGTFLGYLFGGDPPQATYDETARLQARYPAPV
jgi:hypothetical protein